VVWRGNINKLLEGGNWIVLQYGVIVEYRDYHIWECHVYIAADFDKKTQIKILQNTCRKLGLICSVSYRGTGFFYCFLIQMLWKCKCNTLSKFIYWLWKRKDKYFSLPLSTVTKEMVSINKC